MLLLAAVMGLVGCNGSSDSTSHHAMRPAPKPVVAQKESAPSAKPQPPAPKPKPAPEAPPPAAEPPPPPGFVSRSQYGAEWPLTVSSGELRCDGAGGVGDAVFIAPNGTEYALNGLALESGYASIDPIWRYEPGLKKYDLRVNIGPLVEDALALCK